MTEIDNRLVIASNNKGKIAELAELLKPLGLTPVPQGELGVGEAEEPAVTFVENAILKARHAARITGLPALADDSGLAVDALGGEPGVRSARYAGDSASDGDNVRALLSALQGTRKTAHRPVPLRTGLPAPCRRPDTGHLSRPLARPYPGTPERRRRIRLRPGIPGAGNRNQRR